LPGNILSTTTIILLTMLVIPRETPSLRLKTTIAEPNDDEGSAPGPIAQHLCS